MSQESDEEGFDAYQDDTSQPPNKLNDPYSVNSRSSERNQSVAKPANRKLKVRRETDFETRLKNLNKSLRGKLKELNDRLDRVLDKIYIKSLNPNKRNDADQDPSHQLRVADKELENAKVQYDQCKLTKQKLQEDYKANNDAGAVIDLEDKLKQLRDLKKSLADEIIELNTASYGQVKQIEKANHDLDDPTTAENIIYKIKVMKKKKETLSSD